MSPASKAAQAKVNNQEPIDCMIAICDGFNLLLPSDSVVEIVSGVASEFSEDSEKPWLQGMLSWRGTTIPLISFEQQLLNREARIRGSHVAVMYGTESTSKMPFYGVTIQAFPHSVQVQSEREFDQIEQHKYENVLMVANLRGIATVIPDLVAIQKAVS